MKCCGAYKIENGYQMKLTKTKIAHTFISDSLENKVAKIDPRTSKKKKKKNFN